MSVSLGAGDDFGDIRAEFPGSKANSTEGQVEDRISRSRRHAGEDLAARFDARHPLADPEIPLPVKDFDDFGG
ncbi:hypothetical protein [Saccharopolyspora taberi]|uniref:Uncharacterized protein n=1 Tax=Saccharopolyspora taberi TaxID=60895 RepID=A0ABN3VK09_9PSEU